MSPPLIETRSLSKHFAGVQAVRNIDFSLAEGELRCLIGPNGAGKSTFFKLLTVQIEPTSGAVLFRGIDITKLQAHEIARLESASRPRCRVCSMDLPRAKISGSRPLAMPTGSKRMPLSTLRSRDWPLGVSPTSRSASSHTANGNGWSLRLCCVAGPI